MAEFPIADFQRSLAASGILSPDEFDRVPWSEHDDARYLAKRLVDGGLVTEWQAKALLSGRSQLVIGGYLLLERIDRNELGDRYLARHTHLERVVELQFLPKDFRPGAPQFDHFVAMTQSLIRVDHPHLAHVYDVSEVAANYFVVQEHVRGESLNRILSAISPTTLLNVIQAVSSALEFLHQQGQIHGSLNDSQILIGPRGEVQVVGVVQKTLEATVLGRRDANLEHLESQQLGLIDRVAWQGILGQLLPVLFQTQTPAAWMAATLGLAQRSSALSELQQLATAALGNSEKSEESMANAGETLMSSGTKGAAVGLAPLITNASNSTKTLPPSANGSGKAGAPSNRATTGPGQVARAKGSIKSQPATIPVPNRALVWAVAGGIAVLVVAGGVWWGGFFNQPSGVQSQRAAPADFGAQTAADSLLNSSQTAVDEAGTVAQKKQLADQRPAGQEPNDEGENEANTSTAVAADSTGSGVRLSVESDARQTTDALSDPTVAEISGRAASQVAELGALGQVPANVSLESGVKVSQDTTSGNLVGASATSGNPPSDTDPAVAATLAAKLPNTLTAASPGTAGGAQEPATAQEPTAESLFQQAWATLPTYFDLQPANGEPLVQTWWESEMPSAVELTLDLVFDGETNGKGKNYFALEPQRARQTWAVKYSKKSNLSDSQEVATIAFQDGKLTFRWSPGVDGKSNANYLMNSVLQVTTNLQTKWVPLRKPLVLTGLKLTDKEFSLKQGFEGGWWPAATAVRCDFGWLNPEVWGDTVVENLEQQGELPATIRFQASATEQVFWLALATDIKSKLEVKVDVQTTAGGTLVNLKPAQLQVALDAISQQYQDLVAETDRAQIAAENAPYGQKTKSRDYAKSMREKTEENQRFRERAMEQAGRIKSLIGQELPLRLVYKIQNLELELGRSATYQTAPPPPADPPSKPKSKK